MTTTPLVLVIFTTVITPKVVYLVWIIHKFRALSKSVDNVIEEVEEDSLAGEELVRRLEEIRGGLS